MTMAKPETKISTRILTKKKGPLEISHAKASAVTTASTYRGQDEEALRFSASIFGELT